MGRNHEVTIPQLLLDEAGDLRESGWSAPPRSATCARCRRERRGLPKLILYSLNDADWMALATLAGAFQGDGAAPRSQFGNAWSLNDTLSGIKRQLTIYAEQGLPTRPALPAPNSS